MNVQRRLWAHLGVLWRIDMVWWFDFGLSEPGCEWILIEQGNDPQ